MVCAIYKISPSRKPALDECIYIEEEKNQQQTKPADSLKSPHFVTSLKKINQNSDSALKLQGILKICIPRDSLAY